MAIEDTIKDARRKINKLYGKHLAEKSSNDFCLAFGLLPDHAEFSGFTESVSTVQPRAAVLEFAPGEKKIDDFQEKLKTAYREKGWSDMQESMKETAFDSEYLVSAIEGIRQNQIRSVRDGFYKTCGAIGSEIERGARGFQPGPESTASPVVPSSVTEICWLNQTMRTWVDPRLLAEIAADQKIEKIDLPRRLEKEIQVSTKTILAPDYRQKFSETGKGIIIAVIDSEVAIQHPALRQRVVQKQNYCKELWGNPDSHATAVAGIIGSDDPQFTGIAPEATIYNYKVLATNQFLNGDDFGGALAIQQALEDGAHIANCSWGAGPVGSVKSREAKACDTAWALGLAIVKSAGNRGPGAQTLTTPADADGIIVVGATDKPGSQIQNYSSRGPTLDGRPRPHLLAPGGTLSVGVFSCQVGGGFGDSGAGTSFAAPHISGMLALLLEREINLTPDELRDLLFGCCRPFVPNDANIHGHGLATFASFLP